MAMEVAYLASNPRPVGFAAWPWWLYVAYGLPVCGLIIYFLVRARRRRRAAQFEGPAVTGTAQVLSAARESGLGGLLQSSHSAVMSRIGLRVEIPGRPPYDVTVSRPIDSHMLTALCVDGQRWGPGQQWHVKPDMTLPVQVDSANPEDVRIDFSSALSAASRRKYQVQYWVQWGIVGIGLLACLICLGLLLTGHRLGFLLIGVR